LWTLEHDGDSNPPQRVVPDGHPELILNSGRPFHALQSGVWRRQPRAFLAGQIDGPLLLRPGGTARILGIRFQPHGAAALFGPCMHELRARFTTIDDLSPALAHDLDDALGRGDAIAGVQQALLRHSRTPDPAIEEALRRMIQAPAVVVAGIARELGMSVRQFERRFGATVGLSPRLFGRMRRFQRVFRVMEQRPHRWATAAVDCGYYDQAHLIRDFKQFSGETPAVLLADDADLARHFLERFGVSHSYNTSAP
jgi:AraC-like DNA-binding protein